MFNRLASLSVGSATALFNGRDEAKDTTTEDESTEHGWLRTWDTVEEVSRKLEILRVTNAKAQIEYRLAEEEAERYQEFLRQTFRKRFEDARAISLHPYASAVRLIDGEDVVPSYVQTFQAKVCRNLHVMGIMGKQSRLLERDDNSLIGMTKSQSAALVEETTDVTVKLLNKIFECHQLLTKYQKAYEAVVAAQEKYITLLRNRPDDWELESQDHSDSRKDFLMDFGKIQNEPLRPILSKQDEIIRTRPWDGHHVRGADELGRGEEPELEKYISYISDAKASTSGDPTSASQSSIPMVEALPQEALPRVVVGQ